MYARQLGCKIKSALAAFGRILLQGQGNDALELLRDVLAHRVQGRRRCVDDLVQQLLQISGSKRPRTAQELVHHRAQRIQIRAVGELQTLHLFGRHVRRTAGDAIDARDVGICDQGDAEVDDAHVAVLRQHDVRGFDVTVDDTA